MAARSDVDKAEKRPMTNVGDHSTRLVNKLRLSQNTLRVSDRRSLVVDRERQEKEFDLRSAMNIDEQDHEINMALHEIDVDDEAFLQRRKGMKRHNS